MKATKKVKSKIAMLGLAAILPISATGAVGLATTNNAQAENSVTINYLTEKVSEVNLTNNNFNSSSSSQSLSTNLTGWKGKYTDKRTTAGIISTGSSFGTYMSSTYFLANNPGSPKAEDDHILMINSKTSASSKGSTAQQGYTSNNITLKANSYYSFKVSFKSDTDYESYTAYQQQAELENDVTLSSDIFSKKGFGENGAGEYIEFSHRNRTYYLLKKLTTHSSISTKLEGVKVFYNDNKYVGFTHESLDRPVFVEKAFLENAADGSSSNILAGATTYVCEDIVYNAASNNYTAKATTPYYKTKTEYTSLNDYVYGSIYINGLKDKDGKDVKADFVEITSKDWVTLNFFVATGNSDLTTSLELWLGAKEVGRESSGVVFFDDCHVTQFSENAFWSKYNSTKDLSFSQTIKTESGVVTEKKYDCTKLMNLRVPSDALTLPNSNFDFEDGIYNGNVTSVKNWKIDETASGRAQVFDVQSPEYFKHVTGYDFVGSTLSCEVELDGKNVTITPNQYALALWTDNNNAKVTSRDIDIQSNQVYKITAKYKVSKITSGNVYMFVKENDKVLKANNLTEKQYALTKETASAGVTANGSDEFNNKYNTIEFYVKGGVHYDSSINFSLGLGKEDENSTGCVVFDSITVEKSSTSAYESATNKVELNSKSGTPSISNGNFNGYNVDKNSTAPYAAKNWTVEGGNGLTFNGVINTQKSQYDEYFKTYTEKYNAGVAEDENPFLWAKYVTSTPKNSAGNADVPDNVFMLSNITKSWQTAKSSNMSLNANTKYLFKFNYKTYSISSDTTIKLSIFSKDNELLLESEALSAEGAWKNFEVYLDTASGANEIYATISLGNENEAMDGYVFLDNFTISTVTDEALFESKKNSASVSGKEYAVVDMSNFHLNLPSNSITTDLETTKTPGYTGSITSGDSSVGGIVLSEKFGQESVFKIVENEKLVKDKNVFFITNRGVGAYAIDSNFNFDLEQGKYYSLSFKIKTHFNYNNPGVTLKDDKKYVYGATFGLTGFEYAKGLISNDEYTTYTIYFNPSEAKSAKLHLALISDSMETIGSMALYDLDFKTLDVDAEEFKSLKEENAKNTFFAQADNSTNDDSTQDDSSSSSTESTPAANPNNDLNLSILISSLITGLAVILAVVLYAMRHVKIRKIEKKRKESYDRKESLNVDIIKQKARAAKEEDIAQINDQIEKFESELSKLEKAHKEKVIALREKDQGKISKETDREFKIFAQKRTVIAEKIDSLKKQLEDANSPEYLLSLERKIYSQDEAKRREMYRSSKKANAEKAKAEKAETKKANANKVDSNKEEIKKVGTKRAKGSQKKDKQ